MKKYWIYLKYILEHKKNVFKTCWKRGLYIHAFTHDLSKFLPSEFFPYANWFYGEYGIDIGLCPVQAHLHFDKHKKTENEFEEALEKHYIRNKHHWKHWEKDNNNIFSFISLFNVVNQSGKKEIQKMPHKYIMQMICDWEAMSLKFGNAAKEYYLKNYDNIKLHRESRAILEEELGLFPTGYDYTITAEDYMTLDEIKRSEM